MDDLSCRSWSNCRACWHHDDQQGCTLLARIETVAGTRPHPDPRRQRPEASLDPQPLLA